MTKRPWRSVDADLFRFSTTDLRELHVAVMAAFDDAAVLAPALNLDQVRAAMIQLGWDDGQRRRCRPRPGSMSWKTPSLIVEAAGGWDGPPIICSSGRPTVATVTLIRQLTARGAVAFQHADFDIAGLSITGWLSRRAGTVPWRMGAADYRGPAPGSAPAFDGPIPETPWDPVLREAVDQIRRPVYEEQVRAGLLAAMRRSQ